MLIQNKFGIEVETTNMSLEELEKVRIDTLNLLGQLNHELNMRKISAHKLGLSKDVTTPAKF